MNQPGKSGTAAFSMVRQARGMFWRCDVPRDQFNDFAFMKHAFMEAISLAGATIVKIDQHCYEPHGLTIFAILEDSHAVLHTWPEIMFVMVELFTCGSRATPAAGIAHLEAILSPRHRQITEQTIQI